MRCWCWPGNTNDQAVLPQVRDGMRDWRLGRVVTIVDRGMSSEANLDYLTRAGGHYIAGERMRSGAPLVEQALSRQGCYSRVRDNLRVKEVRLDGARAGGGSSATTPTRPSGRRPPATRCLARLGAELDRITAMRERAARTAKGKRRAAEEAAHVKAECALRDHPALGRWLRQQPRGGWSSTGPRSPPKHASTGSTRLLDV